MKTESKILSNIVNIILIIIFAFPFFWMFSSGFQTLAEIMRTPPTFIPKTPQFSNFYEAWTGGPFFRYTLNSILSTSLTMLFQLLTIIPAAYAFACYEFRGKNIFWAITLMCLMIPGQLIFLPNYILFSKMGLLNTIWPLVFPFATSSFGIFMLRQTFKQVPKELLEAARIDNASEWMIVKKIFVPIAKPTVITVMLFTFISRWNDYFWPLVMTTLENARTLPVGIALLKATDGGIPWNVVMASNVILVLPILVAYFIAQNKIIRAFTYTGIK
ncbi:carbohydrate ABC transporter permease [Peptoniphilus sp. KCTC 25270]|uniref:carbohydrate ABC transporter permease n=1 Tax=Peptoniphilus sp. KCTC 25270 TaxID=2897414 RepID=UPI001E54B78B|nr:carbohydrate ABC transporter permease [Peptoniphilus sp. KCTC 25270]MCD1147880.1 carbohydrate ABC transporter permease [Peptoniphilus sp. KCTC 25270]